MTQEINVLFLAGAAESVVAFRSELIDQLKLRGVNQCWSLNRYFKPTVDLLESKNVPHSVFGMTRGGLNPFLEIGAMRAIDRMLFNNKHDYVVVYGLKAIILVGLLSKIRGYGKNGKILLVCFVPGLGVTLNGGVDRKISIKAVSRLVRAVSGIAFRQFHRIVFTNSDNKNLIASLGGLKHDPVVSVVPGAGVDVYEFKSNIIPDTKSIKFVFIGRFSKDKGAPEFLECAKILSAKYGSSVEFHMAGRLDSDNPTSIQQSEIEDALSDGFIACADRFSDMGTKIRECHVGVLPSYHEGRPTAVMEWMACGRAGITTTAPGCRETLVDNESGFLIEPGNADALLEVMERYISQPDLIKLHGKNARKLAEKKFDRQNIVVPATIQALFGEIHAQ